MNHPCFIFDVDGVLTDHWSAPAIKNKILRLIATKLNQSPLIFITGRSPSWLTQNILKPITNIAPNQLKLLATCEHGAVTIGPAPKFKPQLQPHLTISPAIKRRFNTLVAQHSDTMFKASYRRFPAIRCVRHKRCEDSRIPTEILWSR